MAPDAIAKSCTGRLSMIPVRLEPLAEVAENSHYQVHRDDDENGNQQTPWHRVIVL